MFEFVPFDEDTIRREFDELPARDAAKLAAVMSIFEEHGPTAGGPVLLKKYGNVSG